MTIASRYGELFQMSYITRDLDAAMAHCKAEMGIEHFDTTDAEVEVLSFGKLRPLKIRAAFANIGRNQFELIQPISGVSTYSKFLDHNPKGGMHHYGIEVPNYAQGVKEMESQGYVLVQGGRHNETRFSYFDTTGVIGTLTEVVYLQPEERAFMHSLKHKK